MWYKPEDQLPAQFEAVLVAVETRNGILYRVMYLYNYEDGGYIWHDDWTTDEFYEDYSRKILGWQPIDNYSE